MKFISRHTRSSHHEIRRNFMFNTPIKLRFRVKFDSKTASRAALQVQHCCHDTNSLSYETFKVSATFIMVEAIWWIFRGRKSWHTINFFSFFRQETSKHVGNIIYIWPSLKSRVCILRSRHTGEWFLKVSICSNWAINIQCIFGQNSSTMSRCYFLWYVLGAARGERKNQAGSHAAWTRRVARQARGEGCCRRQWEEIRWVLLFVCFFALMMSSCHGLLTHFSINRILLEKVTCIQLLKGRWR